VPPFLAIFGTAILSGALASFTQPHVVEAFVGEPAQGAVLNGIERSTGRWPPASCRTPAREDRRALLARGDVQHADNRLADPGRPELRAVMEHAGFLDG